MKKLMIAAAVAAMIGGAYADMVYDFSANVKTTKAKQGSKTTLTAQVGQNANGDWWYEDMAVFTVNATDSKYLDYAGYDKVVKVGANGVGTLQVSRLDNDGKAALAADLAAYNVPEYYKGKAKWCAQWKYTVDGTCIRVKGSEKIAGIYEIADCCTATQFTAYDADTLIGIGPAIDTITLYRFGGVIGSKCMNVEWVGSIGEGVDAVNPYTTIPSFALAGQGTWSDTQKDSNKLAAPGIASISGNIVGIWWEPICEVCCGADASALAYNCDLTDHNITGYVDADGLTGDDTVPGLKDLDDDDEWGTAAFGTFTLKFNSKLSF